MFSRFSDSDIFRNMSTYKVAINLWQYVHKLVGIFIYRARIEINKSFVQGVAISQLSLISILRTVKDVITSMFLDTLT